MLEENKNQQPQQQSQKWFHKLGDLVFGFLMIFIVNAMAFWSMLLFELRGWWADIALVIPISLAAIFYLKRKRYYVLYGIFVWIIVVCLILFFDPFYIMPPD